MIQAVKDLQRLREISSVVVRHGFGELLDRSKLWDVLGRREAGERPSPAEMRLTSARRFRETLAELGPASIAQVHRARLPSGENVVVKVQRPGIEQQIRSDTDLLFYLARFLEGVIEETGIYTPTGIVSEFRQAMLIELDFENEARNLEEFARNHAKAGREFV